jgi:hypothetical protein
MKRREFIQVGLAGAALLATARWAMADAALDTRTREIVRAIVPVVLAGALPAEESTRAKAIDETVEAFGRAVSALAPAIQEELGQMFSFLAFGPTRLASTGIFSWREAKADDIARFLEEWRHSRFELKRAGYRALTQLIQGAWFDNPLAWKVIGYPGPPDLAAGSRS